MRVQWAGSTRQMRQTLTLTLALALALALALSLTLQAQRALAETGAKLARQRSAARRALGVLQVQPVAADPQP